MKKLIVDKGLLREATQEARRLGAQSHPPARYSFRLKRRDPRTQHLLRVIDQVAQEIQGISIALPQSVQYEKMTPVLDALRACEIPIDEIMQEAGIRDPMQGIMSAGLGILATLGGAFGGRTRDSIKILQETMQTQP